MEPIEILGDVQRLRLQPDDILVLRSERGLTREQAEAIQRQIHDLLGQNRKVMILDQLAIEVLESEGVD